MDFVNVQWQGQPPDASVHVYNPEATWAPSLWLRDTEAQTLSTHEVVREFLMNMVIDGLRSKGLPLMACPHTNGLQLENVISWIIDSHSVMCSQTTQHQDSYEDWTGDSPVQGDDDNDDNMDTQHASHIVAQLTAFAKSTGGKTRKPMQQSRNVFSGKKPVVRKRPAITFNKDSGEPFKRQRSAPGTIHKCNKCDQVCRSRTDLIKHKARHSLDRPFKCDKCNYRGKTHQTYSLHYQTMHQNKYPHYCGICGRGCRSLPAKIEHELSHLNSEEKPFKCKYCNKGYPSQTRLDLHVRHHEEDKKIKCEMCEAKFVRYSGYKYHLEFVHKGFISVNSNKCLVCDLEMVERHLLMEHMKEYHKDVGESCDACGMKFTNYQKLEAHKNRHHRKLPPLGKNNEVSFKIGGEDKSLVMCELCGGLFADALTLSQHMPIHKDKGLTDDKVVRITSTQSYRGYHGRDQLGRSLPETYKPKLNFAPPNDNNSSPQGVPVQASKPQKKVDQGGQSLELVKQVKKSQGTSNDNASSPQGIPVQASKPKKKIDQGGQSLELVKQVKKSQGTFCTFKNTKTLEKDSGNTAMSRKHRIQIDKSQGCQSKRPPNPSAPLGTLVQASKPGKKIDQGGKSVVLLKKVNTSHSIATKTLKRDSGNTNIPGKPAMQTVESQNNQSKNTDKPARNVPPKGSFIIYTKSPDIVADMLLKGQLKLSSKVPIPGSAKFSSSRDKNTSQTINPSNQVSVPSVKDTPNPPVPIGLFKASTTATKLSQSGVPSAAPVKLVVTRDGSGLQSSPMPSPTSHPQRVQTLESSMVDQTKATGQPERSHLQPQMIGTIAKDRKTVAEIENPSNDGKATAEGEISSKDGKATAEGEISSKDGKATEGEISSKDGKATTEGEISSNDGKATGEISSKDGKATAEGEISSKDEKGTAEGEISSKDGKATAEGEISSNDGKATGEISSKDGKATAEGEISSKDEKGTAEGEISSKDGKATAEGEISSKDGKATAEGDISSKDGKATAEGEISSKDGKGMAEGEISSKDGPNQPIGQ